MFIPTTATVRRIEAAEARSLVALVTGRGAGTFAHPLAGGFAIYRGADSPLNKVFGVGFEPLTEEAVAEVEQHYAARGAPVQFEVATHADAQVSQLLARRGYRLTGYEDVHACALSEFSPPRPPADLTVRRARDDEREVLVDVLVTGFSHPPDGEHHAEHDDFGREVLERVFRDMAATTPPEHWVALREGRIVGGAAMTVAEGITMLYGAATLPEARRRGVQRALLNARLADGHSRGAELAVVTTQPGSRSQQNVMRAGFSLAYARAVWLRSV